MLEPACLKRMRGSVVMLPPPGESVALELLDEVDRLLARVKELEAKDCESLITLSQVQDRAKDKCDDLQEALLALLGAPGFRTEYECEHGTPLGQKCIASNCHLKPVRFALKHLPK